jgi:hypothetical protein
MNRRAIGSSQLLWRPPELVVVVLFDHQFQGESQLAHFSKTV